MPCVLSSFTHHRGPIPAVAGLSDGRVACVGYDGAVSVFDPNTETVTLLGYHEHLVTSVAVDEERGYIATGSADYTVRIWDAATGACLHQLAGHLDDVEALCFLPDGRLVSAGRDRRVLVHDLGATYRAPQRLTGPTRDVLALSSGGGLVFAVGDDRYLHAWSIDTLTLVASSGPFPDETDCCVVDPQARLAALGCDDGTVRIVSLDDVNDVRTIAAHARAVKSVVFLPDGTVASAAYDRRLRVHDPRDGSRLSDIAAPPSLWARSLRVHPAGGLVGGTFDGGVLMWSQLNAAPVITSAAPGNPCLNDVAVAAGGRTVVAAGDDGRVVVIELNEHQNISALRTLQAVPRHLLNAVAVDDRHIFAGSHTGELLRWSRAGREAPDRVDLGEGPVNAIVPVAAGVLVGTYSGAITFVDDVFTPVCGTRAHGGPVKAMRLAPDGRTLVSCSADGSVHIRDVMTLEHDSAPVRVLRASGAIANDIAISPSGETVVVVGRDFTVTAYSLRTGDELWAQRVGSRSLRSCAFLTEELVVVGDYWGTSTALDAVTGAPRSTRRIAGNGISGLVRISDGAAVATSYDSTVHVVSSHETHLLLGLMAQRVDGTVVPRATPLKKAA